MLVQEKCSNLILSLLLFFFIFNIFCPPDALHNPVHEVLPSRLPNLTIAFQKSDKEQTSSNCLLNLALQTVTKAPQEHLLNLLNVTLVIITITIIARIITIISFISITVIMTITVITIIIIRASTWPCLANFLISINIDFGIYTKTKINLTLPC